jgi:serine/threonine protein kinase
MKSIKKKILDNDPKKLEQVMVEKEILQRSESHNHLVRMHFYFESATHYNFVLDFCPGGELFFHLNRMTKFKEDVARTIFA